MSLLSRYLLSSSMWSPPGEAGAGDAGAGDAGAAAKPDAGAAAGAGDNKGTPATATLAGDAGAGDNKGKDGAAGAGKGAEAAGKVTWPEKWREEFAGEDAALLAQLKRYTDPFAVMKKGFSLEKRLSSGELKSQLPENATAEQVKAWRTENGIPTEEKQYVDQLALPKGVVLGKEDEPRAQEFAKVANELGLPTKDFNRLVAWSYERADALKALQEEADGMFKQNSEDALRDVWKNSADFKRNINAVSDLMSQMPEKIVDQFRLARMPNGNILGNDPGVMQWLAQVALELNPAAPLLSGNGSPGGTLETRLAEIRKFRVDNPAKYDADKKMQAEELGLIDAQLKMGKRKVA